MRILVTCRHGLGDSVQLTIPLQHIKKYRPDWQVDMLTLLGKHSCFYGLCDRSLVMKQDIPDPRKYDKVFNLRWRDPCDCAGIATGVPATKPNIALADEFQIEPDPTLFHYKINIPPRNKMLARKYIESLSVRKGIIMVHYEGNSSKQRKDIPDNVIRYLVWHFISLGYTIVLLDWDKRSSLPSESNMIHCPDAQNPIWEGMGTGDAATIAALISSAKLFIGIDSGPLHVAGATTTPSVAIWRDNHPANYYDLADHVVHLIPNDARRHLRGRDKDRLQQYFEAHYQHEYYTNSNLANRLLDVACHVLSITTPSPTDDNIYFEEHWKSRVTRLTQGQWWLIR